MFANNNNTNRGESRKSKGKGEKVQNEENRTRLYGRCVLNFVKNEPGAVGTPRYGGGPLENISKKNDITEHNYFEEGTCVHIPSSSRNEFRKMNDIEMGMIFYI